MLKRKEKQKYRYEKLLRCNESLLKAYLSGLIKDWKSQDITHLVMEDLNLIGDKSYYEYQNVKIKYSRLARLLSGPAKVADYKNGKIEIVQG